MGYQWRDVLSSVIAAVVDEDNRRGTPPLVKGSQWGGP